LLLVRAVQVTHLGGPGSVHVADLPVPTVHPVTGEPGVIIEVRAAGASYPEVLLSRGEYQLRPELPFVPGTEVAGIVISAPPDAGVEVGERVAACTRIGGFAEIAVALPHLVFPLADRLDFHEGAALVLNYHTAYLALAIRGRLVAGETVLVHGAAGGVGTAALQVARGLGAKTIAVVSSDAKVAIATEAGADHVVRSDGPWRKEAVELSDGGVEVVFDPVGGERFTESLRALTTAGRLLVVGFAGGEIPTIKANRLLLDNVEVIGAAWGPYTRARPEAAAEIGAAVGALIDAGHVRPVIGEVHPLEDAASALTAIDERRALGKVVLDVSAG
jgi:NADPH2:quinone reductase